ncbi:UDP-N-acetylmuramate--L-alanine ligase [Pedobacter faecalis]|uniref:UDP-N-acetylmuramate--L-alanine ligase n=1 Tax=Pedobacter faecalis TaxID=3041495 RepID=UPI00254AF1E6|nr:UDP-N-acetylmuramate--L-alanine ligase [Pedobacter sp. ELA7]
MELGDVKIVYLVGIGGIGMSALARYFSRRGVIVAGYDKTPTALTKALEHEGIHVSHSDNPESLPEQFIVSKAGALVIYTPAVPKDLSILNFFQDRAYNLKKRSEVLGMISKGQFCIAVAGTHGKTTTSSIIAHLLTHSGVGCTAFLGGISSNYNTNFLIGHNELVVVEADEYDRSFLTLHPNIAVITSMDADHLDIYGDQTQLHESFRMFAGQLKKNGKLFVKIGLPVSGTTYSATSESAIKATNIRVEGGSFVFDYIDGDITISNIKMMLPGVHNIENAVAAIAVARALEVSPEKIKTSIETFKGVKRRFEYVVKTSHHIYIDDYAHHPEELKACFSAVRQLYPDKKLTVIFQPHLFSRTRDFAEEFATVLGTVDELILLEIYPAREIPITGVDANFLLEKVEMQAKSLVGKNDVLELIARESPELLVTVGAGDIDTLVEPLKNILSYA